MKASRGFTLLLLALVSWSSTVEARRTSSAARANTKPTAKLPFVNKKEAVVEVVEPAVPAWKADLLHRAKVGFYFGLWYALNIVYNSKLFVGVCRMACIL